MFLKDVAVGSAGSNDLAAGETGHDREKYRSVILGFRLFLSPLKAKLLQGFADPGEGSPIEITCQIIRRVGEKFATPESDEEIEIFALDPFRAHARGCSTDRPVRGAQWRSIAAEAGQKLDHLGIRTVRQQCCEQRILPRPCTINLVDLSF